MHRTAVVAQQEIASGQYGHEMRQRKPDKNKPTLLRRFARFWFIWSEEPHNGRWKFMSKLARNAHEIPVTPTPQWDARPGVDAQDDITRADGMLPQESVAEGFLFVAQA